MWSWEPPDFNWVQYTACLRNVLKQAGFAPTYSTSLYTKTNSGIVWSIGENISSSQASHTDVSAHYIRSLAKYRSYSNVCSLWDELQIYIERTYGRRKLHEPLTTSKLIHTSSSCFDIFALQMLLDFKVAKKYSWADDSNVLYSFPDFYQLTNVNSANYFSTASSNYSHP